MTTTMAAAHDWRSKHAAALDGARRAIRTREFFSAFPESASGKIYGETANADGRAAFDARLGTAFPLDQPAVAGTVATERSPYGLPLGVAYPQSKLDGLLAAAVAATASWSKVDVETRAGIALEILARVNRASFEMAYATMHTTGQGFMMAFQAGGPHAQDRALEAIAYAYEAMLEVPAHVVWEKPQGKNPPLRIDKSYRIVPRGVSLAIGCSTFPTWNSYPGIFASFVAGNAVVVKPHPQAVLPLAITVAIARDVLREADCDPNAMLLAVDTLDAPIAKELALRPEIGIIDYTGGSAFGEWLEEHAHAVTFTEKAGINSVVIDSTDDLAGMVRNLAMSIALYSGQMCTAPQNIFIPRDGIATDAGLKSFDEVVASLTGAIDGLLSNAERAVEVLGAIPADATLARVEEEGAKGGVVLASRTLEHPQFPAARIRTPLVATLDAADGDRYDREMFGPIAFAVATANTSQSLELATRAARARGAITAIVYSTDPAVLAQAEERAAESGVSLAENLTGTLLVNQSAAFSDYHVSGANPAGNASLTDAAFVASRFRIVQTRAPHRGE